MIWFTIRLTKRKERFTIVYNLNYKEAQNGKERNIKIDIRK